MRVLQNLTFEPIPSVVSHENVFNSNELFYLRDLAINSKLNGKIGGNNELNQNPSIRSSKITWLEFNDENEWIYNRLETLVSSMNEKFFRFKLTQFVDQIQLSNYDCNVNGHYSWHIDMGGTNTPSRKLSLVLQLSDHESYEGGDLEIQTSNGIQKVPKKQGFLVAFPSWTLHRVTPVTKGNRQSLVLWVAGPRFE